MKIGAVRERTLYSERERIIIPEQSGYEHVKWGIRVLVNREDYGDYISERDGEILDSPALDKRLYEERLDALFSYLNKEKDLQVKTDSSILRPENSFEGGILQTGFSLAYSPNLFMGNLYLLLNLPGFKELPETSLWQRQLKQEVPPEISLEYRLMGKGKKETIDYLIGVYLEKDKKEIGRFIADCINGDPKKAIDMFFAWMKQTPQLLNYLVSALPPDKPSSLLDKLIAHYQNPFSLLEEIVNRGIKGKLDKKYVYNILNLMTSNLSREDREVIWQYIKEQLPKNPELAIEALFELFGNESYREVILAKVKTCFGADVLRNPDRIEISANPGIAIPEFFKRFWGSEENMNKILAEVKRRLEEQKRR